MASEPYWISRPRPELNGTLAVPGDKSVSHRALLFNAIADGDAGITGLLEGEDCLATLAALRAMGVRIERQGSGAYRVHGGGIDGLSAPAAALDLGNSGTGMRLLAGLLAGQRFPSVLKGDESLSRRPMARIIRPLSAMGAAIRGRGNRPPLNIEPVGRLSPIRYGMPVASAQVKSALLLAALYADGETEIVQPGPSRDHSERLLAAMGAAIEVDGLTVRLRGPARLAAADIAVPGDLSSAAFTLVAASIVTGSDVTLPAVGVNPTRRGVLDILGQMGAQIELGNERTVGGEPVADIRVRSAELRGIDVDPALAPLAIDEFPVLFVAAAAARGTTRFSGIEELRHKESDRIGGVIAALRELGVNCEADGGSATIRGGGFAAGAVDSLGDHRLAMAFAVAGLVARGPVRVANTRNVATSYPGFAAALNALGAAIEEGE